MDMNTFKDNMLKIASFGMAEDGAVTRLLFSREYMDALSTLKSLMLNIGFHRVETDSVHNLFGYYNCGSPGAKTILVGSHLDSVKEGGIFDGLLGVISAVECVGELIKSKISLKYNICVCSFNGEEGNILGGTFGSRSAMGMLPLDNPDYLEIAKNFNLTRADMDDARIDTSNTLCYIELHVEQGRNLEMQKKDIGVVTGLVGLKRYKVTVEGRSNHSGTTPMIYRNDALVGAGKLIAEIDSLARIFGNDLVATVGKLDVFPNAIAVIPGKVEMVLEIRNLSGQIMSDYYDSVCEAADRIPNVRISFEPFVSKEPVSCEDTIQSEIVKACEQETLSFMKMPSGATHDATAIAARLPIGMIFVPSKGGISHCKDEWTDWEAAYQGVRVLYKTLLQIGG